MAIDIEMMLAGEVFSSASFFLVGFIWISVADFFI